MTPFARHGCGFRHSDCVLRQLCCVQSCATSLFESDAHSTQLGLYESGLYESHSTTTKRAQDADRGRPKVACEGYGRTQVTLGVDATGAPMRRDASPARRCGYASYCRRFEKEKDGGAATIRPEEHAMRIGGADLHAVGGGQAAGGWTLAFGCILVDGRGPAAAEAPQGRTPSDRQRGSERSGG